MRRKYKSPKWGKGKTMSKPKTEKERVVTIDGKDYKFDEMSEKAQVMTNHVADLENKIGHSRFNLDQLMIGHEACLKILKEELDEDVAEVIEDK